MDEPMDAEADSTQPELGKENVSQAEEHPLLRPGSMVMMTLTPGDYESQYWPKLEEAINHLLTMAPGQGIPISYEQMYSCVYKCVCKQFSERLYSDLMQYMSKYLEGKNEEFQAWEKEDGRQFLEKYYSVWNQYQQALAGIVPIFNYMNRYYVESKLKTNLHTELKKLFRKHILEKHLAHLFSVLEESSNTPFIIPPALMCNTIQSLHSINPEYATLKPELFSRFIPNVLPHTSVTELDRYIEETQNMQIEMRKLDGFNSCESTRKRYREEDGPVK